MKKNIYRQLCVHPNTHGTISCSKQQTNRLVAWRWSSSSSHLGMANASRHGWAAVEGQHGSPSFATDLRQSNRFAVLFTSAAPFFGCNSEKTSEAEASPIMDHVLLGLCFEVQNLSLRQSMKHWSDLVNWRNETWLFHDVPCNSMQFYTVVDSCWFMLIGTYPKVSLLLRQFPLSEEAFLSGGKLLAVVERCWTHLGNN